jgi:hypothetical protein
VPQPVRISLRLLGLALLILGAACLVLLVQPGPHAVAEAMGVSCSNTRHGQSEQRSWWDATTLLWTGFWVFVVTGAVLRIITRPEGKGPLTIDLRRRPRL